jgi:DeoR/GlpR family transcriptional regulator of sugar metabolism
MIGMSSVRPAFAEERHQRIADIVSAQGRVRIADLVEILGVSEPTIRKDLNVLERQRVLRRTHGGAIAVTPQFEPTIDNRSQLHLEAKHRIASACVEEIGRGDSIFLDTGTTVHGIAERLDKPYVNVLTNALGVAATLADKPTIRHTLVGGQLRPLGGSLVGPVALDTLRRFTVNIAFISASGLTGDGISVADVSDGQIKQAVIEHARRVILAIDSSKFGNTDFFRICSLDRIDMIITDTAYEDVVGWCRANQIDLRVTDDAIVGAGANLRPVQRRAKPQSDDA